MNLPIKPRNRGQIDPDLAIARAKIEEANSFDEALGYLNSRETFAVLNSQAILRALFQRPMAETIRRLERAALPPRCGGPDAGFGGGAGPLVVAVCSGLPAVARVFWPKGAAIFRLEFPPGWFLPRPDFSNPQERAMDGPAVYPTTAPATNPTGPNTTAPDRAPKAASPPRPSARASAGANVKNIADARTSLFICGSRRTL